MDNKEILNYLQTTINSKYGGSQTAFAETNKVSKQYLSNVLNGRQRPGPKVLKALGVKCVIAYTYKFMENN